MLDPVQFTALKRTLALRLLTQLPDEALGELLFMMRELLAHHGALGSESLDTTLSRRGVVTLAQMRALLAEVDHQIIRAGAVVPQAETDDPGETQEAVQVMPDMFEDELDELDEPDEITRPFDRPPAIATREAFLAWLQNR